MTDAPRQSLDRWSEAALAAAALAVDPLGLGGASLRAPAGEARSAWLALLKAHIASDSPAPWVQVPADASDHQLLGGIDMERTLVEGRPVLQRGALARADGGALAVAMAERITAATAGIIATALDRGGAGADPARFCVIVQDEGAQPDERPPAALLERLALHIDMTELTHRDIAPTPARDVPGARRRLRATRMPDTIVEALCAAAAALGVASDRAPLLAVRLARALAALDGAAEAGERHAAFAARMVLGPRAVAMPAPPAEDEAEAAPPPPPDDADADGASGDPEQARRMEDQIVEAAVSAIPRDILALIRAGTRRPGARGKDGKAGEERRGGLRGRPIGSRRGDLRSRARLDLLDTLRAAAPWQKLRGRVEGGPLKVRREDVRIRRFRDRQASTTIFVVDASGSAAMDRLGEAKGAVEMLLADCYVRRDEVALIAFRGAGADILLPATRSLSRARRSLAALPGGGGTPLAAGIAAAGRMAEDVRRKGRTPTVVLITDGRANVCRDGLGGRQQATREAEEMAAVIRAQNCRAIVVDNAPRPEPKARSLADKMGAAYLALPFASAAALSGAVRAAGAAQPGARTR
jgi:magnesium chelatase subunit D